MKGVGRDESLRMDQLGKKLEVCQVYKVWTHNKPDDKNWQTCDVIIQDSVPLNPAGVGKDGPAVRLRVPVRQGHIGNRSGTPWTPRVGDSVLVGFYMNDRPIILGTLPPQHQLPVCRSSANPSTSKYGAYEDWVDADYSNYYDWRFKLVQWLHIPRKSITGTDGKTWYTTFDHSQVTQAGKLRPICFNYFDKTRDCMAVFECKKGKADPDNCKNCELNGDDTGEGPDYVECENEPMSGALAAMNTWLKILSTDYEGTDDIPRRFKLHWSCGSLFCTDSKCGDDTEGRIWLEAQKAHVSRAHIHFRAQGAQQGANLSLRSDLTKAAHIELFGVGDAQKGRILLANEDNTNYIDIKEDGTIEIHSDYEIKLIAPSIVLDGDVQITGNNSIAGNCAHGTCACDDSFVKVDAATGRCMKREPTGEFVCLGDKVLTQVACHSAKNICGCTGAGAVWQYDGEDWIQLSTSPAMAEVSIGCDGSLFGADSDTGGRYWGGGSWTAIGGYILSMTVFDATHLYAVGTDHHIYIWNGVSWGLVEGTTEVDIISIAKDGALFATKHSDGSLIQFDFNTTSWGSSLGSATGLKAIAAKRATLVWAIGSDDTIYYWNGIAWVQSSTDTVSALALANI